MESRKFVNQSRANWFDVFVERAKYLRIKHKTTIHKESVNPTKIPMTSSKALNNELNFSVSNL